MRISSLDMNGHRFIGVRKGDELFDLNALQPALPTELVWLLRLLRGDLQKLETLLEGATSKHRVNPAEVTYRPLSEDAGKILCLGLNFTDHANEAAQQRPEYPVVFSRFTTSFVGHEEPLLLPKESSHFDYEAELVAVIGKRGRRISRDEALQHVAGYTLLNDGTIRDYQTRTHQWTIGKNFDATGAIGPELVTADELPPGARGLTLTGRLNGAVMQQASTDDMIFDVAGAIAGISEAMTLEPGDMIAMGTPGGVGFARKPPVYLKVGDVFEVELTGLGVLRNPVVADRGTSSGAK